MSSDPRHAPFRRLATLAALGLAGACGCTSLLGVNFDDAHPIGDAGTLEAGAIDARDDTGATTRPDAQGDGPGVPVVIDGGVCRAGSKLCMGECVSTNDALWGCATQLCVPCSVPYATATCSAGACAIGTCEAGRAHCSANAADGCEVDTTSDHGHCGGCGTACAVDQVCADSVCTTVCPMGKTNCGGSCVDLTNSPAHCGSCTNLCAAVSNGEAICTGAQCGAKCDVAFHDCSGQCVSDTPTTCGISCTVCPVPQNGDATCIRGQCGITCAANFNDCAGECVVNSTSSCGPSCTLCSPPANSMATCDGFVCGFTCNPAYEPCGGGCCSVVPDAGPDTGVDGASDGAGDDGSGDAGPDDADAGSTCVHPMCQTGVSLDPACDPCVAMVCAMDSFCCSVATGMWDSTCVGEVTSTCGLTCP